MNKPRTERILGIDPGLQALGYGVIDAIGRDAKLIAYGVVKTSVKHSFPQRLKTIYEGILQVIEEHQPDRMVFEKLLYCQNVSIALSLGQARGAAILAGALHDLPMSEYNPTEIKSAVVGRGRATKEQVQKMVRILLSLDEIPEPDHAADALAAALTHAHMKGSPLLR
ncbi:MAG: crossover junction endodeoxyribonuclease RuvC [Candidatus Omnitrophota bacterium]|jgi:crossover junction endodeoxyribonuclease RuvC|nr:MAG: crossover junction endodeoxyribonuclease RuvC [Candidatus Omnitrophota bacterium]